MRCTISRAEEISRHTSPEALKKGSKDVSGDNCNTTGEEGWLVNRGVEGKQIRTAGEVSKNNSKNDKMGF